MWQRTKEMTCESGLIDKLLTSVKHWLALWIASGIRKGVIGRGGITHHGNDKELCDLWYEEKNLGTAYWKERYLKPNHPPQMNPVMCGVW